MEIDLYKYAERKMPFFNLVVSVWSHNAFLQSVFGAGFGKSVFTHQAGTCDLNASLKQTQEVGQAILAAVKRHDPMLHTAYSKAKQFNKDADELLALYSSGQVNLDEKSFKEAFAVFLNNFNYCTILPYWVLYPINQALEVGESRESFGEELTWYEELKGETRYPQLTQHVFSLYFKKASELLSVSVELASCLTPDELGAVLAGENPVSKTELEKRWNWCAITCGSKPHEVVFNFDQSTFSLQNAAATQENVKELKGSIAYKGIVRGKVKIVNTIDDMKKFEDGSILVSIQSSPSIMPALIKCSAIVTDEGGIMCHASIISRELKKPCVIGTKIATKVLKDGDMVEVDANIGIIKILS